MDSIRVVIFPTFFHFCSIYLFSCFEKWVQNRNFINKKTNVDMVLMYTLNRFSQLATDKMGTSSFRKVFTVIFVALEMWCVYTYFIHVRAYYLFKIKWSEKPKIIKIRHFYFIELNDLLYCVWSRRYFNTSHYWKCLVSLTFIVNRTLEEL